MTTFNLEKLSVLVELPVRTIRFYIQKGMVDRPDGARKTAVYGQRHVEQLLQIKKWQSAGLSLDRIQQILNQETAELPPEPQPEAGSIRLTSKIHLSPGVELEIDPDKARLTTEKIRDFASQIAAMLAQLDNGESS